MTEMMEAPRRLLRPEPVLQSCGVAEVTAEADEVGRLRCQSWAHFGGFGRLSERVESSWSSWKRDCDG